MAYIDELIGHGEQIVYEASQHVIVLISRVLTKLILIGILIAAGVVSNVAFAKNPEPMVVGLPPHQVIPLLSGLISLVLLASIFSDYLRWNAERYVITDRRVLQIRGLLSKTVIDSSLDKINDIALRQSLIGRMFNFGTVEILTAAEEGVNMMENISAPLEFKRVMMEAKHNYERGFGYFDPQQPYPQPGVAAPGPSTQNAFAIHQTLEELATLRDRGILSIDEFEAKKRELLNRI